MALTSSSTFDVADQAAVTASSSVIVEPAVGFGTGGLGRLVHPVLGAYDYALAPAEVEGLDGDVLFGPVWARSPTLGGMVDAVWPGFQRDAFVVERWGAGMLVGPAVPLALLRTLWAMFANPPADPVANPVIWSPSYATAKSYKVAVADVRAGSRRVTLDLFARSQGQALGPVELELRILGDAP